MQKTYIETLGHHSCHGNDLSGVSGSDLTHVSSELSNKELFEIIYDDTGMMPGGLVEGEVEILAQWLK